MALRQKTQEHTRWTGDRALVQNQGALFDVAPPGTAGILPAYRCRQDAGGPRGYASLQRNPSKKTLGGIADLTGRAQHGRANVMGAAMRGLTALTLAATSIAGSFAAPVAAARPSSRGALRAAHTLVSPVHYAPLDPARYVIPFVGTARYGYTFPGATVPFGMVQWSPDTQHRAPGGYTYADNMLRGFSLTHLSGAGCPTYQDLLFLPAVGPLTPPAPRMGGHWAWAGFSHSHEEAFPGYYRVLLRSGIDVRLTATSRTGMARFTYPRTAAATLLLDGGGSVNGVRDASLQAVGLTEIRGWVTSGNFCGHNRFSYTVYVDVRFNRPIRRIAAWSGQSLRAGARAAAGPHAALVLGFDTRRDPIVMAKVGISYVDLAGARRNLQAENRTWDFESVRRAATRQWNSMLGRLSVSGGTTPQKSVFYTALYHALIEPNVFSDVDGMYRGRDNRVYRAQGYTPYTNLSGWDSYRGKTQLLALLAPRVARDMTLSLLAAARQGKGLPKWLLGNRSLNEMVGDSADINIADAYAFGARGFDASSALDAMVAGATRPGIAPDGYIERPGLSDYVALGYVPEYRHGLAGAVSVTLEYALDDFAVAQLAQTLGERETAATFLRRAQNWRNLYNPATGYIQPRWPDGTWRPNFVPSSPWLYTEGNAAQYTWFVPFDLRGLVTAMGGDQAVQRRLDAFFTYLNAGAAAPYAWMGNEPSILTPWAYLWAGAPWKTQAVVRRVMTQMYDPGPGGLAGNDDLGTMSAWYVWAALGLYPAIPGTSVLALHGPLFPRVCVSVPGAHLFTIEGQGAGATRPYIQAVTLNGRPLSQTWLPVTALRPGATLRFTLGATPNVQWGSSDAARPPSFGGPPAQ